MKMSSDLLSIVIPCRNEERLIGKTLRSIAKQTIVTPETPVYIADAFSTDNTVQIIKIFSPKLNITIIEGGLPAVGRNRGAEMVKTRYVLFLDADVELAHANTLENALRQAEKKDLYLVIPCLRIINAGTLDRFFEYCYYLTAKTKILGSFGAGMFLFLRTEAYRKTGGFNESLALGEDWELTHQIERKRFQICDDVVALTSNRRFENMGYWSTFYMWASVAFNKRYRQQNHLEYFGEGG